MLEHPGWEWQDTIDERRYYEEHDMPLTARRPEGGDFEPPPAGTHVARCYRIVDLGTQDRATQQFPNAKPAHQIFVTWELCDELMDDDRPFSIGQFYTLSLHEKAKLRHHLEAWRGRPFSDQELEGFDLENILGAPCMLNVIQETKDGTTRAKITAVMSMPKGQKAPSLVNDSFVYSMDTNAHWDELPEWLQERVMKSHERRGRGSAPTEPVSYGHFDTPDFDDDIPFLRLTILRLIDEAKTVFQVSQRQAARGFL